MSVLTTSVNLDYSKVEHTIEINNRKYLRNDILKSKHETIITLTPPNVPLQQPTSKQLPAHVLTDETHSNAKEPFWKHNYKIVPVSYQKDVHFSVYICHEKKASSWFYFLTIRSACGRASGQCPSPSWNLAKGPPGSGLIGAHARASRRHSESRSASASRRQWASHRAGRRRTTSPPSVVLPGYSVATLDRYINIGAATVTMIGYVRSSAARWLVGVLGQWKSRINLHHPPKFWDFNKKCNWTKLCQNI